MTFDKFSDMIFPVTKKGSIKRSVFENNGVN